MRLAVIPAKAGIQFFQWLIFNVDSPPDFILDKIKFWPGNDEFRTFSAACYIRTLPN